MDTLLKPDNVGLFELAERVLPGAGLGGYALPEDIRFVFSEGAGARLRDVEGREYIDYVGGAGALILGHSHPPVVEAAQDQAARGMHMFGTLSEPAIRLAARLVEDIPCAEKIVYATTGSEATAYAMRLARAFTGRDMVLKFEGAYHGNHDYALTSTFPTALGNDPHGQNDTAGRPAGTRATMLVAPYNDAQAVERIIRERRDELAAIIVEPVQRIIPARPEFLQALRRICDESGVLLIFDEVVTGFRLAYGGAQVHYDVTPDLASFGKVIGAGGPLACVGGRAEILDLCDPRRKGEPNYVYFNGTLHGNPVAAAATLAMLDELARPGIYDRLNGFAEATCAECQKILDRHGLPAIAENTGSLWQILFMARSPDSQADIMAGDAAAARRLDVECMKRGIYALPGVRRFFSTTHGEPELADTLRVLDASCRAIN
ncbi:MAG: aminotransferase class III-fold pyridoxal phosphate-dependent enzyme [Alphaproteobacteria bacterium]|nr:aminotransferase class III-fold pyridoxal phosphate-dependent enzyme [Alphaproteobacteria bacterium]